MEVCRLSSHRINGSLMPIHDELTRSGDGSGEDIASSLETSELDHAGTGTGSGIVHPSVHQDMQWVIGAGCSSSAPRHTLNIHLTHPHSSSSAPRCHISSLISSMSNYRSPSSHSVADSRLDPPSGVLFIIHHSGSATESDPGHSQVTEQWVRHPQYLADPPQQSHRQHALDLEFNLARVVLALAPRARHG
ncbi:hypothetical protein Tco_0690793 [Tanacetum coccineum]